MTKILVAFVLVALTGCNSPEDFICKPTSTVLSGHETTYNFPDCQPEQVGTCAAPSGFQGRTLQTEACPKSHEATCAWVNYSDQTLAWVAGCALNDEVSCVKTCSPDPCTFPGSTEALVACLAVPGQTCDAQTGTAAVTCDYGSTQTACTWVKNDGSKVVCIQKPGELATCTGNATTCQLAVAG